MIDWKEKIKEIRTLLGTRMTGADKEIQIMQTAALMSIAEALKNFNYMKLYDLEVASTYDDNYGEEVEKIIQQNQDKLQSQKSEIKHEEKQNDTTNIPRRGHDKHEPKQSTTKQ